MKIFFSRECLGYSEPGHPESPERVSSTYEYLRQRGFEFQEPEPCTEEDILLAHTPELLERVKSGRFFDPDTPAFPGVFEYARLAAGSAINAALSSLQGEKSFSLMRPPGHHATKGSLGGFCYFNNIAIAVLRAKKVVDRVAIIDFDCHHGNGTEDIFLGRDDILFLSLHQSPLYPGTGLRSIKNCLNYPLRAGTGHKEYLSTLAEGLKHVEGFNPDLIAVSAGFDAYRLDPITSLDLTEETFMEIGRMISELGKPVFAVLEGGYSRGIPECIYKFLRGLEGGNTHA